MMSLRRKMKTVNIGRYNKPILSYLVIISAIFWFFVPYIIHKRSYWYVMYLRSYIWDYRRRKVLIRDNFNCVLCDASLKGPLDVHHKTYDRVCRESLNDLITVCRQHHMKLHGKW